MRLKQTLKRSWMLPFALTSSMTGLPLVADACTRALYTGENNTVITGRNMDWMEDMSSNLWLFPAGMVRDSAAGKRSFKWTSKYGSVTTSGYHIGTTDGMNERGLVANLLYLSESNFGQPDNKRPIMSISVWAQYVLDNYATVAEAVADINKNAFQVQGPALPNGVASTVHLSISDATGDSAIFEYIDSKLVVHHSRDYTVMTNSPPFQEQLAINAYWQTVDGSKFLPGTINAADRFARTHYFLNSIPKSLDPKLQKSIPNQSFNNQAVASVMSLQRAISVPLGMSVPDKPNLSSTLWRTVSDQKNKVYYFDAASRPNTFWVSLEKANLQPGQPAKKLTIENGEIFAGDVTNKFEKANPFTFLPYETAKK